MVGGHQQVPTPFELHPNHLGGGRHFDRLSDGLHTHAQGVVDADHGEILNRCRPCRRWARWCGTPGTRASGTSRQQAQLTVSWEILKRFIIAGYIAAKSSSPTCSNAPMSGVYVSPPRSVRSRSLPDLNASGRDFRQGMRMPSW